MAKFEISLYRRNDFFFSERTETPSVNFCEKHPGKAVRFYCNPCSRAICEVCWEQDHKDWKSHGVTTLSVYLEPQHRIQSRISDYREDCERLRDFLKEWETVVTQIGTVERKREAVLRSESTRAIEEVSSYVRNSLKCQMADIQKFKAKLLDQFGKIERSFEDIFGDTVATREDDRNSSSAVGGPAQLIAEGGIGASASDSRPSGADGWSNVGSSSSEGGISVGMEENLGGGAVEKKGERKERVLVGVKETGKMDARIPCQKAVYNWETREVMCFARREESVISVIGVNEANAKLELKRTMKWKKIRGSNDYLWDICMDEVNNTMYGVVEQIEGDVMRVEELDQCSLKKKGSSNTELDTRGLLNGKKIYWFLVSKRDIIALAVVDYSGGFGNRKWDSVAIYRNRVRRVHTLSHLNIKLKEGLYCSGCVLVNETTLLLSCGFDANKVAVVSLPPQSLHNQTSSSSSSPSSSADSTANVKYVILIGVDRVFSLVWIPFGQPLEGYLWVEDCNIDNTGVYKVDLETDLKNVETGHETQLQVHKMSPLEKKLTPLCSTDDSTLFALSGDIIEGRPVLLKLDFNST